MYYYFPLSYMFVTRYKKTLDKLSWLVQRIFPVFVILVFQLNIGIDHIFIYFVLYMFADLIFTSLYEIGYIYNDVFTIKKETNPTIRLSQDQLNSIESQFAKIAVIKIMTAVLLCVLLMVMAHYFSITIFINNFLFILLLMLIAFVGHNYFRSRVNIVTFSILVCCKFLYALFLFIPIDEMLFPLIVVIFMFPLLRIVEHSSKPKYKIPLLSKIRGKHDIFRVLYFVFLLVVSLFAHNMLSLHIALLIYVVLYFFIYRLTSYYLVKMKIHQR